jgi:hypothetical protein
VWILKDITTEIVKLRHELTDIKNELKAQPSQTAVEQLKDNNNKNTFLTLQEYLNVRTS